MKAIKVVLPLTLLLFSQSSIAVDFSKKDKKQHIAVSTLISTSVYAITKNDYKSYGVCIGTGIAKELYDEAKYNGFSWEDMAANAIGCGIGLGIGRGLIWSGNKLTYSYKF